MKALILKDLFCLRAQAKSVLLVLAVWLVISVTTGNGQFFSALSVIYVILLPMMSMSFDERAHWDSRALTMPVTRAQIVLGRYAAALLMGLAMLALGCAVTLVMDGAEQLSFCLGFFFAGVLMLSVGMPLMLKLGVEKARIAITLCYLIPFVLLLAAEKLGLDWEKLASGLPDIPLLSLLAALSAAALAVSVLISVALYSKKEFCNAKRAALSGRPFSRIHMSGAKTRRRLWPSFMSQGRLR